VYRMYWLAYLISTAKPISIRRLAILFVLTYVGAAVVLPRPLAHGKHALSAFVIAEVITGLAWVSPLIQASFYSLTSRRIRLDALVRASGPVQFTYGFALLACAAGIATAAHVVRAITMGEMFTGGCILGVAVLALVACRGRLRIGRRWPHVSSDPWIRTRPRAAAISPPTDTLALEGATQMKRAKAIARPSS
jgi:hypothetical protein